MCHIKVLGAAWFLLVGAIMENSKLGTVLNQRELPALYGLRGVFALVVVAFHVGYAIPGDLGVTAFFVLSGFLITRLLLQEWQQNAEISLRAFWIKRALRIFPAYYALILLSIAADTVLGNDWTIERLAAALSYTLNYHNAVTGMRGQVAHAWSLAVEEQFYILWPVAFAALVRRGTRSLLIGLVAVVGAVTAWRATLYLSGIASEAYVYNAFDTRMDSLALGCLVAVLANQRLFLRTIDRLASRAWYPVITLVLLAYSRMGTGAAYHFAFGFTVDSILAALLILQVMVLHEHRAWRWLDHKWCVWLGNLSYPIYLWHTWAMDAARKLPSPSIHVTAAVTIGITLVLASGSYYGIERPFQALRPVLLRRAYATSRSPQVA